MEAVIENRHKPSAPKSHAGVQSLSFILLVLFAATLSAQESWPADGAWREMLDVNWQRMQDPTGDVNPDAVDVINNIVPTCSYFYATSTSLFFRMALAGNPIQSGSLRPYAWMAAIDVNGDSQLDWIIRAAGITEYIQTFCYLPGETLNWQVANPVSAGYVRSVNMGSFYYLDMQAPLTALQRSGFANNVSLTTPLRFFYFTSTTEAVTVKDATVPTTVVTAGFGLTTPTAFDPTVTGFGRINDTRDASPYSSAGEWSANEIVLVNGSGWPGSGSVYYNGGVRSVRIKDPSGNVVWSGTVTTNASGAFASASTWTIPASAVSGNYSIEVEDPRSSGVWNRYDTFSVNIPVAIRLSSFDACREGETVVLQWVAENTTGVAGFILERASSEQGWETVAAFRDQPELQAVDGKRVYVFRDERPVHSGAVRYRLSVVGLDGSITPMAEVSVALTLVPQSTVLETAYPNPFNPETQIRYTLAEETEVRLAVYDAKGRCITVLYEGRQRAGAFHASWNGTDDAGIPQAGGVYFIRLETDQMNLTQRVIYLK